MPRELPGAEPPARRMTQSLPRLLLVNTGAVDREASIKLLAAILTDPPWLSGAACIGRHEMFDPVPGHGGHQHQRQERIRRVQAARLCAGCPAIRRCTTVTVFSEKKEPAASDGGRARQLVSF